MKPHLIPLLRQTSTFAARCSGGVDRKAVVNQETPVLRNEVRDLGRFVLLQGK